MTRMWKGPSGRLVCGVSLFALNTAYLAAFATASLFYFVDVVLHMALGIALAIVCGRRLTRHWSGLAIP